MRSTLQPYKEPECQVFISSVIKSLKDCRNDIRNDLEGPILKVFLFEEGGASTEGVRERYLRKVRECALFVLIWTGEPSPAVLEELEEAIKSKRGLLIFAQVGVDRSPIDKLLVQYEGDEPTWSEWKDTADLRISVTASVENEVKWRFQSTFQKRLEDLATLSKPIAKPGTETKIGVRSSRRKGSAKSANRELEKIWKSTDPKKRIRLCKAYLKNHPTSLDAHRALAESYADLGEFKPALRQYQFLASEDALTPVDNFNAGACALQLQEFALVIALFGAIPSGSEVQDFQFHLFLGVAMGELGLLTEAKDSLIRARDSDPDSADAVAALGITYNLLESHEQAIKCMDEAISRGFAQERLDRYLFPSLWRVENYERLVPVVKRLALVEPGERNFLKSVETHSLTKLGQISEAERSLAGWESNESFAPKFHVAMAAIDEAKDDIDSAFRHLEKAYSLDPDDDTIRLSYADHLGRRAQNDQALKLFRLGIPQESAFAPTYASYAAAEIRDGNFESGLEAARQSVFLNPDLAIAHFNAACALSRLGYDSDALSYLLQAIAKDRQLLQNALEDPDLVTLRESGVIDLLVQMHSTDSEAG